LLQDINSYAHDGLITIKITYNGENI